MTKQSPAVCDLMSVKIQLQFDASEVQRILGTKQYHDVPGTQLTGQRGAVEKFKTDLGYKKISQVLNISLFNISSGNGKSGTVVNLQVMKKVY